MQHYVQLFDEPQSLAEAVAEFVEEGLSSDASVLVVMTFLHWQQTAAELGRRGVNIEDALFSGRLTVRDAAGTMSLFMRHGRPRRSLFEETVGALVSSLTRRGSQVRVYGEMVDLLAAEGNLDGALELEQMWNDLGERETFALFCGYSAVNFGNPLTTDALRTICQTHTHVRSDSRDVLAAFLVGAAAARVS